MARLAAALLLTLLGVLVGPAWAQEAPVPEAPTRWVTDTVGLLSPPVQQQVDGKLAAYERQTGHQVIVWIGGSIGDASLADWAASTFAAWGIGRAGEDDGLVVFVLAEDQTVDIEVGYGLEGVVPDAIAYRVRTEVMAPLLQAGEPDRAVVAGVDALLTAIEGRPFVPEVAPAAEAWRPTVAEGVMIAIGAVLFLVLLITNPRLALWLLWAVMARGGGGGGGGGGFSGGGGRSGGGGSRGS